VICDYKSVRKVKFKEQGKDFLAVFQNKWHLCLVPLCISKTLGC